MRRTPSLNSALEFVDLAVGAIQSDLNVMMLDAVKRGDARKVKLLLQNPVMGVDPNLEHADSNENNWDAFIVTAAIKGNSEIVKMLADAGANVDVVGYLNGLTALCESIVNRDRKTFDVLLRAGADVDAKCDDGSTAVHFAASHGRSNMLQSLLKRGADANAEDREDHTPTFYAKLQGHFEAADTLNSYGGRMNRDEWPDLYDFEAAEEIKAQSWIQGIWNDKAFNELMCIPCPCL